MVKMGQYMAIAVILLGLVSVALGGVFIAQGKAKADYLREAMQVEKITLGLDEDAVAKGEIVDTGSEAQNAGDTVREHRHGIAETYEELLGEGRFDPTNPGHLSYAQALNLENYLYLAVAGFGLTDVVLGSGVFMLIVGIALMATGLIGFYLARRAS